MEELRSTEILDKEIEADARKKAEKILADAEAECGRLLGGVDGRIKSAAEQKEAHYKEKLARFERNALAALPLEKERYLVKFYADSVSAALNEYLEGLGPERRLELLGRRLGGLAAVTKGRTFRAKAFGISAADARKVLFGGGVSVVSVSETTFGESGEEPAAGNSVHEGIILESGDGLVRVRLTVDQLVREVSDEHRVGLAEALFGGKLPE